MVQPQEWINKNYPKQLMLFQEILYQSNILVQILLLFTTNEISFYIMASRSSGRKITNFMVS